MILKKSPLLAKCPQRLGFTKRTRLITPRKPNSAKRPVAKAILTTRKRVTAHIGGSMHNIRRFCQILIYGKGARDLPGTRYGCVRGVRDFLGHPRKTKRRSIYGSKSGRRTLRRKWRS